MAIFSDWHHGSASAFWFFLLLRIWIVKLLFLIVIFLFSLKTRVLHRIILISKYLSKIGVGQIWGFFTNAVKVICRFVLFAIWVFECDEVVYVYHVTLAYVQIKVESGYTLIWQQRTTSHGVMNQNAFRNWHYFCLGWPVCCYEPRVGMAVHHGRSAFL